MTSSYIPLKHDGYDQFDPLQPQFISEEEFEEFKKPITSMGMKRSESKSGFTMLTRATSFMTWDTTGTGSKMRNNSLSVDDEEAQNFPTLLRRKMSLHSLSGMTILPTIYGSTNTTNDDNVSECTYVTGCEQACEENSIEADSFEADSFDVDSKISYDKSTASDTSTEDDALGPRSTVSPPAIGLEMCEEPLLSTNSVNSQEIDVPQNETFLKVLSHHVVSTSTMVKVKSQGIKIHQPAPRFSLSESIWTFSGSFTIIFVLCFLSVNIPFWNEKGHAFPLGPFGALTTLQYSLGNAAPAQPRNVLLGSTFSGIIAICFTYIPETILSAPLRIALATSTAIATMAALGIMHPPGGAIALVFALGGHHWGHLLLTLVGCCIAVLLATIINNLNPTRQYPQYWHFSAPFEKS